MCALDLKFANRSEAEVEQISDKQLLCYVRELASGLTEQR